MELVSPSNLQAKSRGAKAEAPCLPEPRRANSAMRKLVAFLMTLPIMQATAADLHVFAAAGLTDALQP